MLLFIVTLCWLMAGFAHEAAATIVRTASAQSTVGTSVTTRTFNITVPTGNNRELICGTAVKSNSLISIPTQSVTYGSASLIKVQETLLDDSGTDFYGTSLWKFVAHDPGTISVVVTWAGTISDIATAWCASYTGVDQADDMGFSDGAGVIVATTPITINIFPFANNSMIVDNVYSTNNVSNTGAAGQTDISNRSVTGVSTDVVSSSDKLVATFAPTTMSWTPNANAKFAVSALALNPAADVPAGTGPQFSGTCNTVTWTANTETDLSGYRLYDRANVLNTPTLIQTVGSQVVSIPCSQLNFNVGQHYLSILGFDTSSNASPLSSDVPFSIISSAQVDDLTVSTVNTTDVALTFTEVDNGAGSPATYDVRFAVAPMQWGTAASVSAGTCATPMIGISIGQSRTCTVTGLTNGVKYNFELVPYRGTLNVNAVFGPFSNIAEATTGAGVPAATTRLTRVTDIFNRGDGSLPNPPWSSGYTPATGGFVGLSEVSTNATDPSTTVGAVSSYNAFNFRNDQWAEVRTVVFAFGSTESASVGLRWSAPPTANGYTCLARRNGTFTSSIRIYTNGANVDKITENATTWASNDILRCEVVGNVISLYRNNGGSPLLTYTDAANTYTSGRPAIVINPTSTKVTAVDNFVAGEYVGAASGDSCGCDQH